MTRIGETSDLLKCSFCGKSQKQVKKLIAGPGVYICDECIDLCNEIIEEELNEATEADCPTDTGAEARSGVSWRCISSNAGERSTYRCRKVRTASTSSALSPKSPTSDGSSTQPEAIRLLVGA